MTSWQRSRASPDPIAATAPTAFAGPAPFRKWLPSTTEPRRLGVATDAEKSWPGVLVLAELKIEKGNLVECAAKGLGEAQDLESDACGRRAERLDKHRVVLLAGLAKATKRFEAQPLVDRSGGGLVVAAHLVDANHTGRVGGAEECEQQLRSAVALLPQVLKESQRLDGRGLEGEGEPVEEQLAVVFWVGPHEKASTRLLPERFPPQMRTVGPFGVDCASSSSARAGQPPAARSSRSMSSGLKPAAARNEVTLSMHSISPRRLSISFAGERRLFFPIEGL